MKFLILLVALALVFVAGCSSEPVVDSSSFLDQHCDVQTICPPGYECASFSGIGLKCYPMDKDICEYITCPLATQCVILESYPPQVMCS